MNNKRVPDFFYVATRPSSHPMRVALLLVAVACVHGSPRRERWFGQEDLSRRCAPEGGQLPVGHFTIWMLVLADGTVPAAFIHDSVPAHESAVLVCFSQVATEMRRSAGSTETVFPVTLVCEDRANRPGMVGGRGTRHQVTCSGLENSSLEQPLDARLAKETLFIANWASPIDAGWAERYAGLQEAAEAHFRAALLQSPEDGRALSGLAEVLVARGAEQGAALAAALAAVRLDAGASATHETLLRVCLSQGDDECVAREVPLMRAGRGASARILLQAPLNELIQASFGRLQQRAQDERDSAADGSDSTLAGLGPLTPLAEVTLVPVETRAGEKAERRLNVDSRGSGPLLPVVLLPGLGGGLRDFEPQLRHLALSRRAVAIDLSGMGFSDPPINDEYTMPIVLQDLEAALHALTIDRSVLVAHGLSALIAVAAAAQHPERVAGLILLDPFGDLTHADPAVVEASLRALSGRDYLTTYDLHIHSMFEGSTAATRQLVLREAHRLSSDAAAGYFGLAAAEHAVDHLRSLSIPIRILQSSYDDEPFSIAALMPEIPATTVENTSPWIMLDVPIVVNQQIDALLLTVDQIP